MGRNVSKSKKSLSVTYGALSIKLEGYEDAPEILRALEACLSAVPPPPAPDTPPADGSGDPDPEDPEPGRSSEPESEPENPAKSQDLTPPLPDRPPPVAQGADPAPDQVAPPEAPIRKPRKLTETGGQVERILYETDRAFDQKDSSRRRVSFAHLRAAVAARRADAHAGKPPPEPPTTEPYRKDLAEAVRSPDRAARPRGKTLRLGPGQRVTPDKDPEPEPAGLS